MKRLAFLLVGYSAAMAQPPAPAPTPAPAVRSFVKIFDRASGQSRVVFTGDGFYQAPNWSPDGEYLLFNTPGKLWRLPLATGMIEQVDTGDVKGLNNDHGISPDGKLIAISAGDIYVLPAAGGKPKQITNARPSYFHGFSPDGKWIVFCGQRNNNFDIYRIRVDGTGKEERLTSNPGYDDGPEYSPDGKWIYFNSNRSGSWDIWRMPAEGAGANDENAEQITSDALEDWFPHISPDGKWMTVVSFEKGIPNHPPNKNVVIRLTLGISKPQLEMRDAIHLFGGQGTINVNSWSPGSTQFAYVSYELLQ